VVFRDRGNRFFFFEAAVAAFAVSPIVVSATGSRHGVDGDGVGGDASEGSS